jgi:hypothetical protein
MDLATAPLVRSRGLATALLAAGQRAAAERGALVALTRTRAAPLFARHGWSVCGQHVFSTAQPRAVLAELAASAQAATLNGAASVFRSAPTDPLVVRPLRRIELGAVVRLYEEHSRERSGWLSRSEAYWEWLLARGACDRIYIASTTSNAPNFSALLDSIVGYVCLRQSRIVELVTAPGREDACRQLAERACADAREQDDWTVRYDGPVGDGVHELFRRAGGRTTIGQQVAGEVFMARLLDPLAVLRTLASTLGARAAAAKLPRPAELGIELRASLRPAKGADRGVVERYRIALTKDDVRIQTGGPSRQTIVLSDKGLAPIILGDCGAHDLLSGGRIKPTSAKAARLASALFPASAWWRPLLDDLLA